MRIGIDCRMWSTTTGRYVREIVTQFTKLDTKNEYVLFFLDEDFDQVSFPENFKKVRANIMWHTFSEQLILPWIFLKENVDFLHVPHFNIPILYPKKLLVTIHDLTIMRVDTGRASTHSWIFYKIKRLGFRIALSVAIFRSKKILTVTNFVKDDLVETFNLPEEKIVVAPNAVSEHFKKYSEEEVDKVLPKYNIQKPYLFYFGNAHPHKNVEGLLKAFEIVADKRQDLQFVLGGKKYFFYERIMEEWADSKIFDQLNFAGFIEDDELPLLLNGAELLVNPSMYEGFGLQLIEAFACGTRVVCSNTTSLPEVGGDAAYYFDPYDPEDMAKQILFVLDEPSEERIDLGHKQTAKYSWEKSARTILEVYKSL